MTPEEFAQAILDPPDTEADRAAREAWLDRVMPLPPGLR
jgi:hypothetical protein